MSGERKNEPPFKLDMDFAEALERFVQTKPKEVAESIERSKQKRPPGAGAPERPSRSKRKLSPSTGSIRKADGD